jgi:hypothetical protein
MKYEILSFTVEELIELFEKNSLDLKPPYQRNPIWTTDAKQRLIDSIVKGYPIPNLFMYKRNGGVYEMVDGQQRSRTIIGFHRGHITDSAGKVYAKTAFPNFLDYKLAIIVLSDLKAGETMENFYTLVNSNGLRLNRPELRKAEYYDTRFLHLLERISIDPTFRGLDLFGSSSLDRMNDVDLVGELVSQLLLGITDKKDGVDKLFKKDITTQRSKEVEKRFKKIVSLLSSFDEIYSIKKTRYKQRNDFYTLFGLVDQKRTTNRKVLEYFYRILVLIGENITPTNDRCAPLKEYAFHCVTQSNSKAARLERLRILSEILLNKGREANETQKAVLKYYNLPMDGVAKVGSYFTISLPLLQRKVKQPLLIK